MGQNDAVSIPVMNSCWKKPYNESGSFWVNLNNQFQEFIQTPMKDHKDCFKLTWHRVIFNCYLHHICLKDYFMFFFLKKKFSDLFYFQSNAQMIDKFSTKTTSSKYIGEGQDPFA